MERNIPTEDLTWDLDYNSIVNATSDPFLLGLNDFHLDFKIKLELLVYKKDLSVGLESVDLKKLMNHLVKDRVASQEMSKYFHNLDYDRLEEEVVAAGFLVNELLRSIESGKTRR